MPCKVAFDTMEFTRKGKAAKSVVEMLKNVGVQGDLPESSHVSFFHML